MSFAPGTVASGDRLVLFAETINGGGDSAQLAVPGWTTLHEGRQGDESNGNWRYLAATKVADGTESPTAYIVNMTNGGSFEAGMLFRIPGGATIESSAIGLGPNMNSPGLAASLTPGAEGRIVGVGQQYATATFTNTETILVQNAGAGTGASHAVVDRGIHPAGVAVSTGGFIASTSRVQVSVFIMNLVPA